MRMRLLTALLFCLSLLTTVIFAEGSQRAAHQSHFFGRIGMGAGVSVFDDYSQNIVLAPTLTNRYINESSNKLAFEFNIDAGYRAYLNDSFDIELSLNAYLIRFGDSPLCQDSCRLS